MDTPPAWLLAKTPCTSCAPPRRTATPLAMVHPEIVELPCKVVKPQANSPAPRASRSAGCYIPIWTQPSPKLDTPLYFTKILFIRLQPVVHRLHSPHQCAGVGALRWVEGWGLSRPSNSPPRVPWSGQDCTSDSFLFPTTMRTAPPQLPPPAQSIPQGWSTAHLSQPCRALPTQPKSALPCLMLMHLPPRF